MSELINRASSPQSNRRIIVVDDNQAIHNDFRKIFGLSGTQQNKVDEVEAALFGDSPTKQKQESKFDLDFASQGLEALEMVKRAVAEGNPYAMAFMDVRMPPGLDGIETTAKIWEADPDIQVAICTAYSDYSLDEIASKLRHSAAFVIIKKPFDIVEVLQIANAFTEKWRLHRQERRQVIQIEQTVRMRTEELLRSEERFRLMVEQIAGYAIFMLDPEGRIMTWNAGAERSTGYPETEVTGRSYSLFFPPEDVAAGKPEALLRQARSEGHSVDEGWRVRKDGTRIWVKVVLTALRDSRGQLRGFSRVVQDLSERKQAEEQLVRQTSALETANNELKVREQVFRTLADNVPDAIGRIDRQLRFVYVNRVLENTTGIPAAAFIGRTNVEAGLAAKEDWRRAAQRVFVTGKMESFEFAHAKRPDDIRSLEARLVPEFSAGGDVQYVLAVIRDVTGAREVEKDRRVMEVQLRQAQKLESIGQLAAGVAHEINTPTQYVGDNTRFLKDSFESIAKVLQVYEELLQAVKGNCVTPELVARVEESCKSNDLAYLFEQIPAAIRETLEGIERVTKIVRAMKEFSHPGGKTKAAADLNKAIETTATVARNEWKYVAELVLELEPALPPVPCFLGEFNQVILNLIVNAAHAIADAIKQGPQTKGTITVRTRRDGDWVEVRVSDTGTGIPEVVRSKIFEPFFTTKDVGKGTGQGLSMVYGSIVKKHGGKVSFETETGKGTTFILRLPIVASPESEPRSVEKNGLAQFNTEFQADLAPTRPAPQPT